MAFSDLLMAFCSLKSVCENALTGLVWESLAPRLQALDSCSHFTVHTVLVSVFQGLKSPHGELTIKFVLYCIVLYCIVLYCTNNNGFPVHKFRHFAGKPVEAYTVNRLSVQGRVKMNRKKRDLFTLSSKEPVHRLVAWWRRKKSAVFFGYKNSC